ncbi:hypothetical protein HYDPIDRAFT_35102 [Hydnomerulius pinastri MD-312]|uniref:Uncharacterized protein n=1 Tax=Hydnomerulius pinastri MD-312 TaxID=994086 RepID=A0A0C2L794_9AGAM|nr:hypothetical protein HYDPIDRAFT_35102 [Hydnomerulius pinastri MD-312]
MAAAMEVIYERRVGFRVIVKFMSKKDWTSHLKIVLEDLQDENLETTGMNDDLNPATNTLKVLQEVYSHHKNKLMTPPVALSHAKMFLNDQTISARVGKEETFTSNMVEELREELQSFVSSHNHEEGKVAWWVLVDRVQIYRAFKILSTGTILVDLPGYGDSNLMRAKQAELYMAEADSIIVAYDVCRVIDDPNMRLYLKKW